MPQEYAVTGPLPENVIASVVKQAEQDAQPGQDAKVALVAAAAKHLIEQLAFDLAPKIAEIRMGVDMMHEGDAVTPAFRAAITGAYAVSDKDADVIEPLDWADPQIAEHVAGCLVRAKLPIAVNRGKWLAKLGIVKQHIEGLKVPAALSTEGAAAPVAEAPVGVIPELPYTRETAEMMEWAWPPAGFTEDGKPIPPAIPQSGKQPADSPPGFGAAKDGFLLLKEGTDLTDTELCKRLDISRSTLNNYLSGRTGKVKINPVQVRILLTEIDTRVAKLQMAADKFREAVA